MDRGTPLVFFNRIPEGLEADGVVVDDYQGAFNAVEHLISGGSKRIAHIAGPQNLQITKNRLNGYLDALRKNNLEIDEALILHSDFSIDQGRDCATQMLDLETRPDAIFAVNDQSAFGAMFAIKAKNLRIPEDIAIIGFTDEPLTELVEPSLSSVAQPVFAIGKNAVELFLEQVNKLREPGANKVRRVLKTELKLRNSSLRNTNA